MEIMLVSTCFKTQKNHESLENYGEENYEKKSTAKFILKCFTKNNLFRLSGQSVINKTMGEPITQNLKTRNNIR